MASLRQIRRRIRSVKGTAQLTRAMQLVAASKMRRAQAQVVAARPYAEKISQVIADVASQTVTPEGGALHPLLARRAHPQRVELLIVSSDRGMAGGLNTNLIRAAAQQISQEPAPVVATAIGRKGRDWLLRTGRELRAEFIGIGDRPAYLDIVPVARVVMDDFINGYVDRVDLVYTRFVNTLVQRPIVRRLLPVEPAEADRQRAIEYIYEPSPEQVLAELLPRFVEVEIYEALLEATASFHSAQMVAMRSATDNANEIVNELTLMYNQARQTSITTELIDIVGGSAGIGVR
ncbi:MAG: ATP synthase F1 subunit gamma [Chloroflexi bacterium]|nr:ATP synthase F1 subunit gamma [Chloroflexota bacterium]MCL5107658.1 ATP synthase F1 subunit gamma [Chloroflexota bacterium]